MKHFLVACILGFAANAFAWAFYTNAVWWPTGAALLADGGAGYSTALLLQNPTAGVTCSGTGSGEITLAGSNDNVNFVQLGLPLSFDGGQNTYSWDPVTSGLAYIQIQFDGGTSTKGAYICQVTEKGNTP